MLKNNERTMPAIESSEVAAARGNVLSCLHPESAAEFLFRAEDYITGESFSLLRCRDCGIGRTAPRPDDDALGLYYPEAYHGKPGLARFPWLVERLQAWLCNRRAKDVEAARGMGGGLVLDIGCGRGQLLEAFRKRGWKVIGTERSDGSARHAREILGIDVRVGPVSELKDMAGRFDAVVLWHVLEHLSDPVELLHETIRLLRPGGVLLVGVPNANSLEARLASRRWFHLDMPRHLWHFSPETLLRLVCEAGLAKVRWRWFAPEFDLFSFIQSTENCLGIPMNQLYTTLRRPGAKLLPGRSWSLWSGISLFVALPLGLIGLLLVTVAGLLKQGSSMTLLARLPERASLNTGSTLS